MATYSQPFIKLTFGGQLAAGEDEWNCGINLAITNDEFIPIIPTNAEQAFESYIEDIQEDMIDIFTSYITSVDMGIPTGATLDYVKLALIGTDGLYMREPHIWEFVGVAGAAPGAYVPQVSLVMTLQSDKFRDPGKYNRFYLPTTIPSGSGQYRPIGTLAKATRTANLLAVLNRRFSAGILAVRVIPAAVSGSDKITDGYRPITRVKVGNVFDTQRRRRNKISEIYTEYLVPEDAPVPVDE